MKKEWVLNNIDMINLLFNKLIIFIEKHNENIQLITNEYSLYKKFYKFLYKNYILKNYHDNIILDNNFDYFEIMYCSDIIDLFNDFKNISYGFTNDIFKNINDPFDLIIFIYDNIELSDNYNDIEDILDEEYDDDYDNNDYYFRL
uniref:Uncharacterized protein n=1 Tax=viral metagenome TaxID=1070528 RepID=A0A6C0C722_9ZZZZ